MNSGRHRQVIFWLPPNAFPSAGYGVVTLENKRFFLEIIEIGVQLKVICAAMPVFCDAEEGVHSKSKYPLSDLPSMKIQVPRAFLPTKTHNVQTRARLI
jgi:hypothetical protein